MTLEYSYCYCCCCCCCCWYKLHHTISLLQVTTHYLPLQSDVSVRPSGLRLTHSHINTVSQCGQHLQNYFSLTQVIPRYPLVFFKRVNMDKLSSKLNFRYCGGLSNSLLYFLVLTSQSLIGTDLSRKLEIILAPLGIGISRVGGLSVAAGVE